MEEGGGASGTALAAAGATAQPREPPPPTALDVRAEAHIKVPSACEIKKMKVPELKSVLSRLGKPDDGLEKALVDKLHDYTKSIRAENDNSELTLLKLYDQQLNAISAVASSNPRHNKSPQPSALIVPNGCSTNAQRLP